MQAAAAGVQGGQIQGVNPDLDLAADQSALDVSCSCRAWATPRPEPKIATTSTASDVAVPSAGLNSLTTSPAPPASAVASDVPWRSTLRNFA
ncbi:MAG TPA: hypothetical protein VKQ29_17195 [Aliidongia sp.]|nr:hypothetical protein [Aliidongia sp.]